MPDHSAIEWTDATWNPVTGCTKVSPGCANCYIERQTPFRIAGRKFVKGDIPLIFHEERLEQPLRWRRPRMIFVNSMSDLFHEGIPDEFIDRVFRIMGAAPQHTFQVLTKRPERMRAYLTSERKWMRGGGGFHGPVVNSDFRAWSPWPFPNVWLGVTIENARHNYRADILRDTPAAVRFISAEPLLGSLLPIKDPDEVLPWAPAVEQYEQEKHRNLSLAEIEWIIVGGESGGRHVRPMHPDWARDLRNYCLAQRGFPEGGANLAPGANPAGTTAFFFKQWGSWEPAPSGTQRSFFDGAQYRADPDLRWVCDAPLPSVLMRYAGARSKSGGKELDGQEWCEMPHPRHDLPAEVVA